MNIDLLHVIDQFLLHAVIINIFLAYVFFQQLINFILYSFFTVGFQHQYSFFLFFNIADAE